jgi:3',5'-cyclic AMP phosphodiesterase CpdA
MGFRFQIEHANIVAYLTSMGAPPDCSNEDLITFGQVISDPSAIIVGEGPASDRWRGQVRTAARSVAEGLSFGDVVDISREECANRLEGLKRLFSEFRLIAMLVRNSEQEDHEWSQEIRYIAEDSGKLGLALMPVGVGAALSICRPFAVFQSLVDCEYSLPAIAFWTPDGAACTLPVSDAMKFYTSVLRPNLENSARLSQLLKAQRDQRQKRKILHISDLHIGEPSLRSTLDWLESIIVNRLIPKRKISQIALTGDVMDFPDETNFRKASEFISNLNLAVGKQIVCVPGNHDIYSKTSDFLGMSGNNLGKFSENRRFAEKLFYCLQGQTILADGDIKCLFILVDSNDGAYLARGHVSKEQRLRLSADLAKFRNQHPETSGWPTIILVHHHPIGRKRPAANSNSRKSIYEFILPEKTASFSGGRDFVNWSSSLGVQIILHGHEHYPIIWRPGETHNGDQLKSLIYGCGSSTGAGKKPIRYAEIAFNALGDQASISSYFDPYRDGREPQLEPNTLADHIQIGPGHF